MLIFFFGFHLVFDSNLLWGCWWSQLLFGTWCALRVPLSSAWERLRPATFSRSTVLRCCHPSQSAQQRWPEVIGILPHHDLTPNARRTFASPEYLPSKNELTLWAQTADVNVCLCLENSLHVILASKKYKVILNQLYSDPKNPQKSHSCLVMSRNRGRNTPRCEECLLGGSACFFQHASGALRLHVPAQCVRHLWRAAGPEPQEDAASCGVCPHFHHPQRKGTSVFISHVEAGFCQYWSVHIKPEVKN